MTFCRLECRSTRLTLFERPVATSIIEVLARLLLSVNIPLAANEVVKHAQLVTWQHMRLAMLKTEC
jgi:hypothetical protein